MPGTSVAGGIKHPIHDQISELQRKIQLLGKFLFQISPVKLKQLTENLLNVKYSVILWR